MSLCEEITKKSEIRTPGLGVSTNQLSSSKYTGILQIYHCQSWTEQEVLDEKHVYWLTKRIIPILKTIINILNWELTYCLSVNQTTGDGAIVLGWLTKRLTINSFWACQSCSYILLLYLLLILVGWGLVRG